MRRTLPQESLVETRFFARSDVHLLAAYVVERDEQAFAALVARYKRMVWGVCWQVLRHHQDTEDAYWNVFVVLMRRASGLQPTKSLARWLYGVAFHVARNIRRSKKRRQAHESCRTDTDCADCADPIDAAIRHEMESFVDATVQRLPEKLRVVFVLCCLNGESKAKVALKLGWPEGTVASRLAKARKIVQQRLRRCGIIP